MKSKNNTTETEFTYYVVTQPHNTETSLVKIVSDHKLDNNDIEKYFEEKYQYDWEEDFITIFREDEIVIKNYK